MKKIILFSIFFWMAFQLFAQKRQISGYVKDLTSGEDLIGASIFVSSPFVGTTTNVFGYFSLVLSDTLNYLNFSYIGYELKQIQMWGVDDTVLYIELKPLNREIGEVEILQNRVNNDENSQFKLSMQQLKKIPILGAEYDIFKALQLAPGISPALEGQSSIVVRGGNLDQNLILLDDVPLYYINHFGGFISTFNAEAINGISFINSGFPSKYGGRLSSVMDIRMKNGNLKQTNKTLSLGLLTANVLFEGPIKTDTSSYLISARAFFPGVFTRIISPLFIDNVSIGYGFYDINAKWHRKINDNSKIYLSFYTGDDKFVFLLKDKLFSMESGAMSKSKWGNLLTAFRWNYRISPVIFSNVTLSYSKFRFFDSKTYSSNFDSTIQKEKLLSSVEDMTIKVDADYNCCPFLFLQFGFESKFNNHLPIAREELSIIGAKTYKTNFESKSFYSNLSHLYLDSHSRISNSISVDFGVRYNQFYARNISFNNIEPRAKVNFSFQKQYALFMDYSEMSQFIHHLSFLNYPFPVETWIPTSKETPPSTSNQMGVGIAYSGPVKVSISSYYKKMTELTYVSSISQVEAFTNTWENKFIGNGIGEAYGIEFFVHKPDGKLNGWFSYTYSRSFRKFHEINRGIPFPFQYDRPHDIGIVLNYAINQKYSFSASWVYLSGTRFTKPIGIYQTIFEPGNEPDILNQTDIETVIIWGKINGNSMPAFHKLDIALVKKMVKNGHVRETTYSIYNLYNHFNPYMYYFSQSENGTIGVKEVAFLPIIPAFSVKFEL